MPTAPPRFDRLDLNLLRIFDAVLEEGSVVQAGRRLSLSPSAISHGLGRLRHALKDDLFTREKDGMKPTPFARELGVAVHDTLRRLRTALSDDAFHPESSDRVFTIACSEFASVVLFAPLIASVRAQAPGVQVSLLPSNALNVSEALEAGRIDLAIGTFLEAGPRFRMRKLMDTDQVYVLPESAGPGPLTLERLAALPHVVVRLATAQERVVVDECIVEKGLRRHINMGDSPRLDQALAARSEARTICAVVSHPLAVPAIVQSSGAVGMLPRQMAERLAPVWGLQIHDDPQGSPSFPYSIVWHERADADPGNAWMRDVIEAASARDARAR
ncbi:LysR family transcriptional regulator [Variovorax sp. VNK109]|uniref:LysR family transcriptional regulator n=1 Tax=Variovorax sp. VNK109 TaxID=3400919 RepID=UPI003BFCF65D